MYKSIIFVHSNSAGSHEYTDVRLIKGEPFPQMKNGKCTFTNKLNATDVINGMYGTTPFLSNMNGKRIIEWNISYERGKTIQIVSIRPLADTNLLMVGDEVKISSLSKYSSLVNDTFGSIITKIEGTDVSLVSKYPHESNGNCSYGYEGTVVVPISEIVFSGDTKYALEDRAIEIFQQ